MPAPSDEDITSGVENILQETWDLDNITLNSLRITLEAKFECDLSDRKEVLKLALQNYIESMQEAEEPVSELVPTGNADDAGNDDEDDSGEGTERRGTKRKRSSKKKDGNGKKGGGGFAAEAQLSADLAEFLGCDSLPRTEVTKRMWAYIKQNNLQNTAPKKGREILCDAKLEKLFKRKKIDMFKMTSALSKMMYSSKDLQDGQSHAAESDDEGEDEEEDGEDRAQKKSKTKKAAAGARKSPAKTKKTKGGSGSDEKKAPNPNNPFNAPMRLSALLAGVLGVQEESRPGVVKRMWEYIKTNELQNPADKREIILDAKLQAVFETKTFTQFSMNKYLTQHLSKIVKAEAE